MDPLSRLLALAPVAGHLDVRCHFGAPWRLDEAATAAGENDVPYHVLLSGEAVVEGGGGPARALRAGDVVMFPGGAAHALHDGSGRRPKPVRKEASDILRIAHNAGTGAEVDILCGRFVLPQASARLVRSLLPQRLVVSARPADDADIGGTRLARLIGLMREEANEQGPGSASLVGHLSAALFALALRFASAARDAPPGLLALAREPRLQPAVLAMFEAPQRPWTLSDLAAQCHMSRATLVRQFQEAVGRSPAEVLAEIRMAHAARALEEGERSVAEIGEAVGYFSEAAFQRAFKSRMGLTPARWRADRGGRAAAAG